jgi:hypothetical protein
MTIEPTAGPRDATRRGFLRLCGQASATAGGLTLLAACNDDVVGAEHVPAPQASATAPATTPAAYSASDADRLNFGLQLQYLLAAYLQRSLDGTTLDGTALTAGTGTRGTVSGGRAVSFSDATLKASVREVTTATVARIGFLRRTLGSAATAQPAINIAGGQGSPFQAITLVAGPQDQPPTIYFDPYASEEDFLLGATALFAVASTATTDLTRAVGATLRAGMGAFVAGVVAGDSILRNALFARANLQPTKLPDNSPTLFARAAQMSDTRNYFDGPRSLDQYLGRFVNKDGIASNIMFKDSNWIMIRRTPEQALNVLYASQTSVASGAFFPAGVNGTIRSSGANSY